MKHKSIGRRRRERRKIVILTVSLGIALVALCVLLLSLKGKNTVTETSLQTETMPEQTFIPEATEPSSTPTPEPVYTPTPTPTPEPSFLSSLDGFEPGTVIEDELIDTSDLGLYFTISEIHEDDPVFQRIAGRSFVYNDDIALSDLRYLKMLHVNFDGQYQVGEMIVNASVAEQVTGIFEQLCEAGYEIYSMYLIDDFWVGNGTDSDSNSIDHNNTSCFCYRPATGSSHISRHALGLAIDINPQQNPYVRINSDGSLSYSHDNASDYVSGRTSDMPHVITESDYAYQLFTSQGWTWGGAWTNPKDYQHFQFG